MKEAPPSRPALSPRQQVLLQQRLRGRNDADAESRLAPRADRSIPPPLSFAQQRLWFLDQLEPGGSTYNMSSALRFSGALNADALERGLNEILCRHEILRTTFAGEAGQPVQIIAPEGEWKLNQLDLSQFSASDQELNIPQLLSEEARRPFDLSRGPLVRAILWRLAPEEHIFSVTFHHIITDGWSSGIFWNELAELYNAFRQGRPSPLTPMALQYADFAVWQRRGLQGPVLDKQLAYWKNRLQDSPPALELPTDHPRPATSTHRGEVLRFSLPPALAGALKNLARKNDATLYMVLLAAFQTLLHRFSRQEDILVGSVTAGRSQTETEALIGFFVNTLVLRADFSGDPAFTELLGRVRETTLGAMDHQDLPLERLVEELQPPRQQGRHPFFQTMFALEGADTGPLRLDGLQSRPLPIVRGTSKFDLTLEMSETADGLRGLLEFNLDLFDAATVQRLAGYYSTLLQSIADHPQQRVSELPLLTSAEREQQIVEWNRETNSFPWRGSVHQLFAEQAAKTPSASAVVFSDQQLTYRELDERSTRLARRLREAGVGPNILVGLCAERSLEMIVGLLAILKAGGAFVPLDPEYPSERLAYMIADTAMPVILTQTRLAPKLPPHHARVLCLEESAHPGNAEHRLGDATTPLPVSQPADLAYVIYTSGSTGRPKGVLIPHDAFARHSLDCVKFYDLTAADRVLQFASLNFDASIEQIIPPLLAGARLILRDPEVWSASVFQKKIATLGLTYLNLPTAYWQQIAHEWAHAPEPVAPHQVRLVIVGGEAMQPETLRLWQQTPFCDVKLLNAYGPTETTITATTFAFPPRAAFDKIPIGQRRGDRTIYILDRHDQPLPIGAPGELHIGGHCLAHGYLNQPDLTREKFIADPFSSQPDARLYKTGDLARFQPDGAIEFLGRLDHQVKIRGFRIEPGEIESVLRLDPRVRDALVLVRGDQPGQPQLVAYVASAGSPPVTAQALRQSLQEKLPAHLIPAACVVLESFPLTPGGKVDRRALPAPEMSAAISAAVTDQPLLPVSVQITEIWQELLGRPHIGQHENFFEIGGHSLLAVKMMERVERVCGRKLPLSVLFAGATIEQLALALAKNETANPRPLIEIQTGGTQAPLFFLHGDLAGGGLYCVNLARLLGPDQPFYVLPPQAFSVENLPTIESMARHHLQILRAHTPHGPYRLGGYCAGGLVALEMAHALRAQGETVELVTLIDTPTHSADMKFARALTHCVIALRGGGIEDKVRLMLRFAPNISQWEKTAGLGAQLGYFARKLARILRLAAPAPAPAPAPPPAAATDADADALFRSTEITYASYIWIIAGHRMKPYYGPLALFWSSEILRESTRSIARWWRLYPQLQFHTITGDHFTSVTRHAGELAEKMRACFARAASR